MEGTRHGKEGAARGESSREQPHCSCFADLEWKGKETELMTRSAGEGTEVWLAEEEEEGEEEEEEGRTDTAFASEEEPGGSHAPVEATTDAS